MTLAAAPSPKLQTLLQQAASSRGGWQTQLGWVVVLAVLAWAWQGAEMRPLDLIKDAGNMGIFAREFFPPNFHDWRIYLSELVITLHIALWGTVLAIIAAVPLGLLSAHNIAPPWVYQPVRRVMDAFRAINEMVFAMLFIVLSDSVLSPACWLCLFTPPAFWASCLPKRWKPLTRARSKASVPPEPTSWPKLPTVSFHR